MFESIFYVLLLIILIVISLGLHRAGARWAPIWIGAAVWLVYAGTLAHFGVFRDFSAPPKIPLLLVLPAFAFIFWFFKTGRHRPLLHAVPRWQPVAFQSFRIVVEVLILGIAMLGLGSKEPTMEGYNFDIISGVTAPLVVLLAFRWKVLPEKWVFWWNIMGLFWLANVVFIFISLGVAPQLWGYQQPPISPEFGEMPYLLIPGIYMPCAVFMHVFSLAQGRTASRGNSA